MSTAFMRQPLNIVMVIVLCALVAACGTDTGAGQQSSAASQPPTPVTTSTSGPTGNVSSISLRLTDAPIDNLARVVARFTAVELTRQSGGFIRFTLNTPFSIDLMTLQGAATADLLVNVPVDADDYSEISLFVDSNPSANFVEDRIGNIVPLQTLNGSSLGYRLRQDFSVSAAQAANFIIDIDLRQSVFSPGNSGTFQLRPVMRLVSVNNVGNISGTVDPMALTDASCSDGQANTFNSVYLFDGHDVVADDINQLNPNVEPVATTNIYFDAASNSHMFNLAFLPAGDYTVASTCNADLENLEADDNLLFFDIKNITVLANNTIFL